MSEELKPCPFCGAKAVLFEDRGDGHLEWYVHCYDCKADGSYDFGSSDVAVDSWNARSGEDALRAENEQLRAALEWYADKEHYSGFDESGYYKRYSDVDDDDGERARAVLKKVTK